MNSSSSAPPPPAHDAVDDDGLLLFGDDGDDDVVAIGENLDGSAVAVEDLDFVALGDARSVAPGSSLSSRTVPSSLVMRTVRRAHLSLSFA